MSSHATIGLALILPLNIGSTCIALCYVAVRVSTSMVDETLLRYLCCWFTLFDTFSFWEEYVSWQEGKLGGALDAWGVLQHISSSSQVSSEATGVSLALNALMKPRLSMDWRLTARWYGIGVFYIQSRELLGGVLATRALSCTTCFSDESFSILNFLASS